MNAQHVETLRRIRDDMIGEGFGTAEMLVALDAAIAALSAAQGEDRLQETNADLIELMQASADEIAEMRRLRATRVPSINQLGGWHRVMVSAIDILKRNATGWIATGMSRQPAQGGG